MSLRQITWLVANRIPRSLTYTHARKIHFLTSKLPHDNYSYNKIRYDGYHPEILTSDVSLLFRTCKRYRTGKKNTRNSQEEDDSESDDEEIPNNSMSKVMTTQLNSMRVDLVVKTCLGMARNKAEVALYESRIRINGEKVLKKSKQVAIGDVVDMICGPSPKNPDFLLVSRITILSAVHENEVVRIKFTRDKSLLVENYEDEWHSISAP